MSFENGEWVVKYEGLKLKIQNKNGCFVTKNIFDFFNGTQDKPLTKTPLYSAARYIRDDTSYDAFYYIFIYNDKDIQNIQANEVRQYDIHILFIYIKIEVECEFDTCETKCLPEKIVISKADDYFFEKNQIM